MQQSPAIEVAESIRGAIEGLRFEWKESLTTIRCSIGVVMVTSEEDGCRHVHELG